MEVNSKDKKIGTESICPENVYLVHQLSASLADKY